MAENVREYVGVECDHIYVIGFYDALIVEVFPQEYPYIGFRIGPVALKVDGELWEHRMNADHDDVEKVIEEGGYHHLPNSSISDMIIEWGGPGADEIYLELET